MTQRLEILNCFLSVFQIPAYK